MFLCTFSVHRILAFSTFSMTPNMRITPVCLKSVTVAESKSLGIILKRTDVHIYHIHSEEAIQNKQNIYKLFISPSLLSSLSLSLSLSLSHSLSLFLAHSLFLSLFFSLSLSHSSSLRCLFFSDYIFNSTSLFFLFFVALLLPTAF